MSLDLVAGARTSLAVGRGLATLRITARRPARVRVLAGSARMAIAGEQAAAGASGEVELDPAWSWQALALAGPDGPPVEVLAEGRGEAPFRINARLPLGAGGAGRPGLLGWRFVDGRGGLLVSGQVPVAAAIAPEDRLDGAAGPLVSGPTTFFLWPPRGAHRLLLTADRAVALSLGSPALESPVAPADALGIAKSLVLRHDPGEHAAFLALRPLNLAELRRADRVARFAGAARLELLPPPRPPPAASGLDPVGNGGQFVMLAPAPVPAPSSRAAQPGATSLSFALRPGHDETVLVPRPRGASGGARVPATLLYDLSRVNGRGALTVTLDGRAVRRASLQGARGRLLLPPLPTGRHTLRVDLPAEGRLFLDQPVLGGAPYRRSRVFSLRAGTAAVRVPKGATARSLGVIVYADGPPRGPAALEAIVDAGKRPRPRQ